MSENTGLPPESPSASEGGLDFDKAEFSAAEPLVCAFTGQEIGDRYYHVDGKVAIPEVAEPIMASAGGKFSFLNLMRAGLFGLVAAIAGALIWGGIRALTGYDIGLIAVVAGWAIGNAVSAGSRRSGGILYRLMAVALVWLCVSWSTIPEIVKVMTEETNSGIVSLEEGDATLGEGAGVTTESDDWASTPLGIVIILVLAFVFSLAAPVLMIMSGPIMILIMGFAFWEAFKISGRSVAGLVEGPYFAHATAAGPPAGSEAVASPGDEQPDGFTPLSGDDFHSDSPDDERDAPPE